MTDILTGEKLEDLYYNKEIELDSLSAEDLIVLSDYLTETELNDNQVGLLEKCLTQLSSYDDYRLISDTETNRQTWNNIIEKYEQNHIPHSGKNIKFKRVLISVLATSVLLFGISAGVSYANGTSLFGLFYNDQMKIVSNSPETETGFKTTDYPNYEQFLADNTEAVVPDYIPEGYIFSKANSYIDSEHEDYLIIFKNSNHSMEFEQKIYFTDYSQFSLQMEVNGDFEEQYSINDSTWNIYSNKNKNFALCVKDNFQYTIYTYENTDELKKIINTIKL